MWMALSGYPDEFASLAALPRKLGIHLSIDVEVALLRHIVKIWMRGFEPPTSWTQTKCSTRLSYIQ